MNTEADVLEELAPQAYHIHARVGYDQGPQVPAPESPRYRPELQSHQAWWRLLWRYMQDRGSSVFTMTPEFGPDGYQAIEAVSGQPIGDLWQINQWMGQPHRPPFALFLDEPEH